ncbi:MAG: hypothetical protein AAFY46_13290, partial [Planctomycetota bacterium]
MIRLHVLSIQTEIRNFNSRPDPAQLHGIRNRHPVNATRLQQIELALGAVTHVTDESSRPVRIAALQAKAIAAIAGVDANYNILLSQSRPGGDVWSGGANFHFHPTHGTGASADLICVEVGQS